MKAERVQEFRQKLEKIVLRYFELRRPKGRILAFPSGKGGVGKTIVVINLASALALKGKKVLVMDLNFALPNIHMYLDEAPSATLTHYLNEKAELAQITGKILLKDAEFHVIPTDSIVDVQKKIDFDKLRSFLEYLKSRYDYILLDLAPGLSKYVVYPLRLSDHIFIVTADVKPAYMDAIKVLKYISSIGGIHEGFIVNMVESNELKYFRHMGVFAVIPYDELLKKAAQNGKTVFHLRFSGIFSSSRKVFVRMADEILARLSSEI